MTQAPECGERCQYAADVAMPEYTCVGGCQYAERDEGPHPGHAPCPACFESCGYRVECGNDWESGPYVHITNIPCRECGGSGYVDAEDATDEEMFEEFDEAFDALCAASTSGRTR